jgi:preprotein translocase subunit SecD
MSFCLRRFNLYLPLLAALALPGGCALTHKSGPLGALRVHIESAANAEGASQTVSILRTEPVLVTIARDPVLTEANLITATLMETPGGFAVRVKFDESGTWALEQCTASNPGKHLVIFGQWSDQLVDGRWLAAPLITRRIGDGILTFTPDASREEAQKLVIGLNNAAKKINTGSLK